MTSGEAQSIVVFDDRSIGPVTKTLARFKFFEVESVFGSQPTKSRSQFFGVPGSNKAGVSG